ncbi:MAG TPA: glycosyltransferase [Solirubrobacteraceae bacterium]|jgi:GT2 family glycosyltransferase|nr:glycosyltransferase [Solirubrobacteraceae bacterium]
MGSRTDILLISSDRAEDVRTSLPAAMAQPDAHVTVIDNGCRDGTAALAREAGAEVLTLRSRLTWCAANNAAIAHTAAPEVLLLNADCELAPDFLERTRPRLTEPNVGSVAPKLVRTLGPGRPLAEIDAAGMVIDRRRKNNLVAHGRFVGDYDRPGECFGADGAAALYRRQMLVDCAVDGQPFDEDFEKYASDVDLAWRAQLLGWRCAYEPAAIAWHVRSYGPSTRARVPAADRRAQFRNRYLMIVKNDRPGALARDLPLLAGYELLALGHVLLRERELLGGYREALERLPRARRARREIQRRRRAVAPLGLRPPGE